MSIRYLIAAVAIALATGALGQTPEPRTGPPYATAAVPLRDFLSQDISQTRAEFLRLFAERDRQAQQRFEAQEKALSLALDATKTAIAADFQLKLQDQNLKFFEKAAAKESFDALEGKVDALDRRLDDMRAASEGSIGLWNILLAAFGTAMLAFSVIWPMLPTRRGTSR